MDIKGFIPISLSDWDGKIASVIFLPRCNMRCPFCYNKNLVLCPEDLPTITQEQVLGYLETNHKWIDGVVITGGEPTLSEDLPKLCKKVKELALKVKVDTNGTNPATLNELIGKQIVDYVALDVKSELTTEAYTKVCGVKAEPFLERIKSTIGTLMNGKVEYEFRTTLVPTLHQIKDVEGISDAIRGCRKFALQNFKSDVETIDPKYLALKPFSKAEMENFLKAAQKIVPNSILRG